MEPSGYCCTLRRLMTWKILRLMMVGLVLGIFVGVLPGLAAPMASRSAAVDFHHGSDFRIVMLSTSIGARCSAGPSPRSVHIPR